LRLLGESNGAAAAGEFEDASIISAHEATAVRQFFMTSAIAPAFSSSLSEIGELFIGLDYAAVAQRIRRTKSTYNPIAARRLISTMLNV
jgi:hypothetical protein